MGSWHEFFCFGLFVAATLGCESDSSGGGEALRCSEVGATFTPEECNLCTCGAALTWSCTRSRCGGDDSTQNDGSTAGAPDTQNGGSTAGAPNTQNDGSTAGAPNTQNGANAAGVSGGPVNGSTAGASGAPHSSEAN